MRQPARLLRDVETLAPWILGALLVALCSAGCLFQAVSDRI